MRRKKLIVLAFAVMLMITLTVSCAAEELVRLVEREELADPVMTSPSSSDPMVVIIVLVILSGVVLAGMTIASAIAKRKK